MYTKLPDLFGRLPKGHLDVKPIEEFREKEASTHYLPGTPDGSRRAHVMVNTGDFATNFTNFLLFISYWISHGLPREAAPPERRLPRRLPGSPSPAR